MRRNLSGFSLLFSGTTLLFLAFSGYVTFAEDPVVGGSGGTKLLPDILGIKVGMAALEVREIVKKQFPPETIESKTAALLDSKFLSVLHVKVKNSFNPTEAIAVKFASPPNENRVTYVMRTSWPSNQQTPLKNEVLTKALTDKFGKPSDEMNLGNGYERNLYWFWDMSGKPTSETKDNIVRDCENAIPQDPARLDFEVVEDPIQSKVALKRGCATGVRVWMQSPDLALVRMYTVTAIDFDARVSSATRTNQYLADRERTEKEKVLEKASGNKPRL